MRYCDVFCCTPNSPMKPSTDCKKVKCTKKGPKTDTQSCTDCKKSKAMNCTFGNSVRTIYLQSYLQVAKWYSLHTFLVTDQIDFSLKNDQSLHTFRPGNQSVLSSQNFQVVDQNVFSQQPLGVIYQSVFSRQILLVDDQIV